MTRRRKACAAVGGIMAVALATASAAFACTVYKGKMVVEGGRGTSTGIGGQSGHGYCNLDGAPNPTGGATGKSRRSITVTVSAAVECTVTQDQFGRRVIGTNMLPFGRYAVNFVNFIKDPGDEPDDPLRSGFGINADGSYVDNADCMSGSYGAVKLGEMEVDLVGRGSGTYTLPADLTSNGPSDASKICVSGPELGSALGMAVPIFIL